MFITDSGAQYIESCHGSIVWRSQMMFGGRSYSLWDTSVQHKRTALPKLQEK